MGVIAVLAADRRQARIILRYIKAFFGKPTLAVKVEKMTDESIELKNGITIEVQTASFRTTRGWTFVAVIAEEIAFWRSDESANPDKEIIRALRPGLSTVSNSLLLCISSPYARRGMLWETYNKHFGKDSDTLVWQGTSQEMHPDSKDLDRDVERLLEEDPASTRAEYFAEFRTDVETFVSLEAVQACTIAGRLELLPERGQDYYAFVDPSGGSSDAMTLGIAHRKVEGDRVRAILDCLREVKPPFSPDVVVEEFAKLVRKYGLSKVVGDRYAGAWCSDAFKQAGIQYTASDLSKSEIYSELLPLLNSKRIELLHNPRCLSQLTNLERRTGSGRDVIDHAQGGHDDLINCAAGALVLATRKPVSSGLYF
jgi:hypothetical protein